MGKRRMFYLTDDQFRRLGVICKKTGLSASEILRRAFDEYWGRVEKKGMKAPGMKFCRPMTLTSQWAKEKG